MYKLIPKSVASPYGRKLITSQHLGQPQIAAKQSYAGQSKVKQLTDATFWNIFHDRNKVVVVGFWADWCRPCDEVAKVLTSIADKYGKGPYGSLVKFYHVQWDPKVNPKLFQRFGFKGIPTVYFYYTSTGKPPTKGAPLLEGTLGGDKRQANPDEYDSRIKSILSRHRHLPTTSESRGWITSEAMVSSGDFADIDKILVEPSPFYLYFQSLYRANSAARLARAGQILTRQFFNTEYQNLYGRLPDSTTLGTVDKANGRVLLLSLNIQLQAYLMNAVHEAVHFFSCPIQGPGTRFHANYGHSITEGFTQFVAEEILKSQKVKIVNPPYSDERAVAVALIQVVGIQSMADDYFRCTGRVIQTLNQRQVAGEFTRLRVEAETASGAAKKGALKKLRQYLESVRRKK